jgi:hypothetical protein
MSQIFPYISGDQSANVGLMVKNGADKPSVFVDFADGLLTSATTLTTVTAVALDSTGASVATVVGTTGITGTVARVDLQTCGAGGTSAAADGDRFRMVITATPSSGGPLNYPVFIYIDNQTYAPNS